MNDERLTWNSGENGNVCKADIVLVYVFGNNVF